MRKALSIVGAALAIMYLIYAFATAAYALTCSEPYCGVALYYPIFVQFNLIDLPLADPQRNAMGEIPYIWVASVFFNAALLYLVGAGIQMLAKRMAPRSETRT